MLGSTLVLAALAASSQAPDPSLLQARREHILAAQAEVDKWMTPYLRGEKDLTPYTKDLAEPHAAYRAKLDAWPLPASDATLALLFSEKIRALFAAQGMAVKLEALKSILAAAPKLRDRNAREAASQALLLPYSLMTKAPDMALDIIWAGDEKGAAKWKAIGRVSQNQATGTEQSAFPAPDKSWISIAASQSVAGKLATGQLIPEMVITTWDGDPLPLTSWKGRPFLIIFTAWWCGACRNEIKELSAILKAERAKGVQSVIVSGDFDIATTLSWLKAEGCDAPVAWSGGPFGLYATATLTGGWPRIIPVGKDFRIGPAIPSTGRLEAVKAWASRETEG